MVYLNSDAYKYAPGCTYCTGTRALYYFTTIQHLARARSVALRLGLVCCLRRRLSTSLVVYSSGFTCLRYNFLLSTIYTTKYYLLTSSTLSLRRRYVVFHTADSRLLYTEHIRYHPINYFTYGKSPVNTVRKKGLSRISSWIF